MGCMSPGMDAWWRASAAGQSYVLRDNIQGYGGDYLKSLAGIFVDCRKESMNHVDADSRFWKAYLLSFHLRAVRITRASHW